MKPGILRNLKIKRVALVDRGANFDKQTGDGAHVMLYKSAGPTLSSVHVDSTGTPDKKAKQKPTDKEPDVKKSILSKILGALRESDVAKREEAVTEIETLAKSLPDDDVAKAHDSDDPMCKCAMCMSKRAPVSDEVAKRFTEIEKRNTELQAEVAKANTALAAEVEKRESAEMVSVLKSFKFVAVDLEKDVAIFRKMKADSPEAFERTMVMMKANDAQLADSALHSNLGSGMRGTMSGDAWSEIEAKAAAIVAKGDVKLSKAQAIDQVLMDPANGNLVKRYRENAQ